MKDSYKNLKSWQDLAHTYVLSELQIAQYKQYYAMLLEANEQFNLTAITQLESVIAYHFADSLELSNCIDVSKITSMIDVGTGAGFPGLVLKIKYPELKLILIEVTQKKINFLNAVIEALGLKNITLYTQDWRTFLRTTEYQAELVCARASLQPAELVRMFQPSSVYKNAQLVYWASESWEPSALEEKFIKQVCPYTIANRTRKYIVFAA